MYRIAMLEDDPSDRSRLMGFLERYQQESGSLFQVVHYPNGLAFLEHFQANFDVIFLDIDMPHMTGMEVAREIRKRDGNVCLIFITGLAQYAVEGYEVQALDYIIKPVEYQNLAMKLKRALDIRGHLSSRELVIKGPSGMQRIRMEDLIYIEVVNHTLYYHTGLQTFEERGSIAKREKELEGYGFARCSTSFLLNLRYVTSIRGSEAICNGKEFTMTRSKKKEFLKKLADYLGENIL